MLQSTVPKFVKTTRILNKRITSLEPITIMTSWNVICFNTLRKHQAIQSIHIKNIDKTEEILQGFTTKCQLHTGYTGFQLFLCNMNKIQVCR